MPTSVKLQDMFSYSFIPILILILCLLITTIILCLTFLNKTKNKEIVIIKPNNLNDIKNKYLKELDNLLLWINENKVSNRHAYQTLSKLIRNFIYEVTGIKVQNYTLSDIEKVNLPILTSLVREYYHPEFAKESLGDIISSLNKTKEVIIKWH